MWKFFRFMLMWLYYFAKLLDALTGIVSFGLRQTYFSLNLLIFVTEQDVKYREYISEQKNHNRQNSNK